MQYKVREAAEIAGVSVRTLHYYDSIGLLKPESVSPAGYRLYSDRDLGKLQQVLFFRELGFSLPETEEIVNNPDFDREKALHLHRELLLKKRKRIDAIIESVDATIQSIQGGKKMETSKMFEAFDMSEIEKHRELYAGETRAKYGNSDAYKESEKKTARYSQDDWARILKTSGEIYSGIAGRMDQGPEDREVQDAVARLRQHISDSFYDCSPEIFRGLGDLYVSDERFTANIDKVAPGLARFLRDAINFYCNNLRE
jgi:DNA-binding transcriptional MerR regulator